jgi:DNA-binding NtrC family response regulator
MTDDSLTRTVLVVDDDPGVRRVASRMLRARSFRVLEAHGGTAAISVSSAHDGAIDLLLTDIVLPGMNGVQLATRIADQRPGIAVIFMSGHPEVDAVRYGVLAPNYPFIHKPFGAEDLLRVVETVIPSGGG